MTIKQMIKEYVYDLNTSLRELNDFDLVDCRQALIDRTNLVMGLLEELT